MIKGLVGEKLVHSYSKLIHEKIIDETYNLYSLNENDFNCFFQNKSFDFVNVTIPYKEKVIPYLDYIDHNASDIGAVNTIINQDGKLFGYNTDFAGMKALINRLDIELKNKKVLILGTGGTSKTAYAVCKALCAKDIYFVSRFQKANAITYDEVLKNHLDANVIINTTPCGMYPDNEALIIDINPFTQLEGVIDVIYNPIATPLIISAKKAKIKAGGGLYMLVAQAVYAYGLFKNCQVDHTLIDNIYQKVKVQKTNLVLIGMPSSGKTTIGKKLAAELHKTFVDTDELIKAIIKMEIKDYFKLYGETEFRKLETKVIKEVAVKNNLVIATGGGVVINDINIDWLKQNGSVFFINRQLELLTPTNDRPLSKDQNAMKELFINRYHLYLKASDYVIDNNETLEQAIKKIIGEFSK